MQRVGFSGEDSSKSADISAKVPIFRRRKRPFGSPKEDERPAPAQPGQHPDAEPAAAGLDVVHRALQLQLKLWCSLLLSKLNATIILSDASVSIKHNRRPGISMRLR